MIVFEFNIFGGEIRQFNYYTVRMQKCKIFLSKWQVRDLPFTLKPRPTNQVWFTYTCSSYFCLEYYHELNRLGSYNTQYTNDSI